MPKIFNRNFNKLPKPPRLSKIPKPSTWIIILLIFIALGIIVSSFLRIITPQQPVPVIPKSEISTTNSERGATQFNNIVFEGEFSEITQPLNIYQATINNIKSTDLMNIAIKTMMEKYYLQEVYSENGLVIYANKDYDLSIDYNINELNFSNRSSGEPPVLNSNSALQSALDFVNFLSPDSELHPINHQIKYFAGNLHLKPASKIDANIIEIPFSYFFDQLPLYLNHETDAPVTIMVDGTNQIQKLVFKAVILNSQVLASAPPITIANALINVNEHKIGSLIRVIENSPTPLSLDVVQQGTLTEAALEYRFDAELKLIYPFYRFEGTFVDNNGQAFQGTLITPATTVDVSN